MGGSVTVKTPVMIPIQIPVQNSNDTIAVWCNRGGKSGTTYLINMASMGGSLPSVGLDEQTLDIFMQVNDCRKGKLLAVIGLSQVRDLGRVYALPEIISPYNMSRILGKLKQGTRALCTKLHPYDKITAQIINAWTTHKVTQVAGNYLWRNVRHVGSAEKSANAAAQSFYELYGYLPETSGWMP